MRLRFPKAARLASASEFALLKREGSSFHGKFIILSVLRNAPSDVVRIGIITSRRVGSAVIRNRIRRKVRELFRTMRHQVAPGIWLVVVARPYASRASAEAFRAEWGQLVRRSGILTEAAP